ncbi:hypothetical protein C8R46DRAFT_881770 [Mycena filopes]|nr:hypothetical protein C8R46DRAFT_881770 [Mycena filopes]
MLNLAWGSGDSALSASSRLLVTTNLTDGIDWYDIIHKKLSAKTSQKLLVESNVPLPAIFIGSNMIAVGSAIGEVSIFKSGNTQALQVLHHNGVHKFLSIHVLSF